ncbi:MAG: hypothetical protein WCY19_03560 [Candidatus Gastranaerophilaceae bacterium]
METNSVDSGTQREYRSRSVLNSVVSNAAFGAVAGAGISYAFPVKEDEFVKEGVKLLIKDAYAERLKNANTKIESLKKEIETITDENLKQIKTKELTRCQRKLVNLEKKGIKNYADNYIKSATSEIRSKYKPDIVIDLKNVFGAKKEGKLKEYFEKEHFDSEKIAKFKQIFNKAKFTNVLKEAKRGAIWCGLIGLVIGIIGKIAERKANGKG